jgi:hypothetical protein
VAITPPVKVRDEKFMNCHQTPSALKGRSAFGSSVSFNAGGATERLFCCVMQQVPAHVPRVSQSMQEADRGVLLHFRQKSVTDAQYHVFRGNQNR